ncbi:flagellin [Rhodobacteraceae bacterium KMM 6894]|nr:flagellin [Rhodobacteraceae bacterium KMM 6894]
MSFTAVGDLAQSLAMRRHSSALQTRMSQLTQELTTGQAANISRHLQGGFNQLSDIENQLTLNVSYKSAAAEATVFTSAMQAALEHVQNGLSDLSSEVLLTSNATGPTELHTTAENARATLDLIVSAMNTDTAGRPLFSGTDVANAPLSNADVVLDAARAAIAGAPDAATVDITLETFFMTPGAGFDTLIYQGGTQDMSPYRLGAGEDVTLSIRADDPIIRAALKDTVMAALADDTSLTLGGSDRVDLLTRASKGLLQQIDGVTRLRADLGFAEERLEQIATRTATETTSLQMARNQLLSVDPFETASALEETQLRLETLYTITARTSRLNLVNFL